MKTASVMYPIPAAAGDAMRQQAYYQSQGQIMPGSGIVRQFLLSDKVALEPGAYIATVQFSAEIPIPPLAVPVQIKK